MRLKIVQAGEPVLRQTARALSPDEIRGPEMQRLIEWMRETCGTLPEWVLPRRKSDCRCNWR